MQLNARFLLYREKGSISYLNIIFGNYSANIFNAIPTNGHCETYSTQRWLHDHSKTKLNTEKQYLLKTEIDTSLNDLISGQVILLRRGYSCTEAAASGLLPRTKYPPLQYHKHITILLLKPLFIELYKFFL